jgi:SRSO17 transposase
MTILAAAPEKAVTDEAVGAFCRRLFTSFARADQRRWGEMYVRGLLSTPGRKTPARMSSETLDGRAVQPLQQFLNQSPWDHAEVRRALGEMVCSVVRPQAWVIDMTVFPKHGRHSVGVARQFVPSVGRTVNCQVAVAATLVAEDLAVPVDWRIQLPASWDENEELRIKAHVPHDERYREPWQHTLAVLDEIIEDWHLPPAPVLVDCRGESDVEPLLSGLESRGLGYVVEVGPTVAVRSMAGRYRAAGAPIMRPTAANCVQAAAQRCDRMTLTWAEGADGAPRQSQFLAVPVPAPVPQLPRRRPEVLAAAVRPRLIVAEWPVGRPMPRGYWITNIGIGGRAPSRVVALAKLRSRSSRVLDRLHDDLGLGDFEGRSFRGWHHHVTLVSCAHGFRELARGSRQAARHVALSAA